MAAPKSARSDKQQVKLEPAERRAAGKRRRQQGAVAAAGRNVARRTITLPPSLDERIEATVGPRNFRAFAQRALWYELQRETIAEWLDEREAAREGRALDRDAVTFAERAWARRK